MQSIRRNIGYQMVYRLLTVVTPLITSPILTRALGAEQLGVYSATQAYVNYFCLFAMLGVENYGTRSIAAVQDDKSARQKLFWNVYAVQAASALLMLLLYGVSMPLTDPVRRNISLIQGLWIVSSLMDINWFYFGCEAFRLTVTRNIVVKLATVASIIGLVHTPADLEVYALIMAGGMVVSQLVTWAALPKYLSFEMPTWREMKRHIRPIFQLFMPLLAFSVFHIMDKSMLDWLSDEANLGYYYSADKLINIPLGVIYAISTVMLPRISNVMHKGEKAQADDLTRKAIEMTMMLGVSIGFGIAAIAPEFVPLFFGPGYEPCVQLVYCFVPVLLVKAGSNLVRSLYLIPAKRDSLFTKAVFGGMIANLISNIWLIRNYGAMGAVLGTLIAEAVTLMIQIYGCRNEMRFIGLFASQIGYLLLGCLMFAAVRFLGENIDLPALAEVPILVGFGALLFGAGCFVYCRSNKNSMFYPMLHNMSVKRKTKSQ